MKRSFRIELAVTITLGVIIAGAYFVFKRTGDLVRCSQPLVNVKGWWGDDGPDRPYVWLTETSLFSHSGWWRLSAPFTFNLATQKKTPLRALQKLLGSDGDEQTAFWELSPDHQHVAWNIECYDTVHSATFEGRKHEIWNVKGPGYGNTVSGLNWLADGHRWTASTIDYDSGKDKSACIGDIDGRSGTPTPIGKSAAASLALARPVTTKEDGTVGGQQTGEALPSSGITSIQALIPQYSSVSEQEVSPDHKHIAVLLIDNHTSAIDRFIHQLLSEYCVESHRCNTLWISRIDGSNAREVGHIEESGGSDIRFLQWMPSGTRVSYIYKDEIYGVDVSGLM